MQACSPAPNMSVTRLLCQWCYKKITWRLVIVPFMVYSLSLSLSPFSLQGCGSRRKWLNDTMQELFCYSRNRALPTCLHLALHLQKHLYCYTSATKIIHGVMFTVVGNGDGVTSSHPWRGWCISYCANTFGKDMNLIILPPAMGK